jgi:hypothetical protein
MRGQVGWSETLLPNKIFVLTLRRNFAANAGIQFHTPEEYFLHEDPRPFAREFDPTVYLHEKAVRSTTAGEYRDSHPHRSRVNHPGTDSISEVTKPLSKTNPLDIILFCGSPGAGKSSFYWRNLQPLGYGRVNQDILKTVSQHDFPGIGLRICAVLRPRSLSNNVETAREMYQVSYGIG